ncbi:hypothetical protein BCR34DRAFT_542592 [Clohesyomyces aquaticus]|uniref:Uncharacterized protein n=1 Tax=Clohesyomyces aquaticus TaxID=1231657 RepID=A0A1Y1ZC27_9PLEO|nr:hypothetical protein BCR34DRAFT_542592 [Clohesyomyces aquaticus]
MATNAAPNVWTQMNYVPPRGQCNFKPSYLSARCPCLRFMLHPLKASHPLDLLDSTSTYECDGCSHHASFHSMENKVEDEVRKRWEQEAKDKQRRDEAVGDRPRKRLREIEFEPAMGDDGGAALFADFVGASTSSSLRKAKTKKANGRAPARLLAPVCGAATRSRGKVTELPDEDYIDLD